MFITIYSTFNNPWTSAEAGQWVEKQLDQTKETIRKNQNRTDVKNNHMKELRGSWPDSWVGSMFGVLLLACQIFGYMILSVGIAFGYIWVKFVSNIISMLTFPFLPILGIFKGLKDHVPSMGTFAFEFNTTQEIDDAWDKISGVTLVFTSFVLPFALFLYGNFLADARREIEKSAQKQDPKNPFPDRPRRSLDSQFISTVLNGIQSMREKWEI